MVFFSKVLNTRLFGLFMFIGRLKGYLVALITISGILVIGQLTFQIVLLSNQPYGSIIGNCTLKQDILDQFGYYR